VNLNRLGITGKFGYEIEHAVGDVRQVIVDAEYSHSNVNYNILCVESREFVHSADPPKNQIIR
jgi:hypothetical protein